MASLKNFFIHSFLKKMEKRDAVIADGPYEPQVKNIGNVPNWDEEEYVIEAPIGEFVNICSYFQPDCISAAVYHYSFS